MPIPLVDLKAQYQAIKPEIDAAIARVIGHSGFILGEEVRRFEADFATFCDLPTAAAVGVDVERDKRLIIGLGAFLTACAVSLSGIIGFAGLVVPHLLRLTAGPDHRGLIPGAALLGGAFLVVADALARSLFAPAEVPVGVFTALVGGPFFLVILRRGRGEYRF